MKTTTLNGALWHEVNALVHAKLAEAAKLPGAVNKPLGDDHDHAVWLTSGSKDVVRYTFKSSGVQVLRFGGIMKTPAYTMILGVYPQVKLDFAGDEAECPDPYDRLEVARSLGVATNELVPYGWVVDDTVTTVFAMRDLGLVTYDGVDCHVCGLDCWVLESATLPSQMKWSGAQWFQKIWGHIKDGQIVRMSDQIHALDGELWVEADGEHTWDFLRLEGKDHHDGPKLVADAKYIYWHPREERPGTMLNMNERCQPFKATTKNWFR